jgi:flagellin-like hook-associated protein FlgL
MNKEDKLKEIGQRKAGLDSIAMKKANDEKVLADFEAKDKVKKLTTTERLDRIEQLVGIE